MGDHNSISIKVSEPTKLVEKPSRCLFCNEKLTDNKKCPKCGISVDDVRCIEIVREIQPKDIDDNNEEMIKTVNTVLQDKHKKFSNNIQINTGIYTLDSNRTISLLTNIKILFVAVKEETEKQWLFSQIARCQKVDVDGTDPFISTWKKQHPRIQSYATYAILRTINDEKIADIFGLYQENDEQILPENTSNSSLENPTDNNKNVLDTLVFNPINRLKSVSDESLKLAQQLLEWDYIEDVIEVSGSKPMVRIILYVPEAQINICKNEALSVCPSENRMIKEFPAQQQLVSLCTSCPNNNDNCHIHTAGYLFYLRKKNLLQEAMRERAVYFAERKNSGKYKVPYNFEWTPRSGVKNVGSNEYELALELNEGGKVWVSPAISADNYIRIKFPNECMLNPEVVNTSFFKTLLLKENVAYKQPGVGTEFDLSPGNNKNLCSKCKLEFCPFLVAGYVQFMKS